MFVICWIVFVDVEFFVWDLYVLYMFLVSLEDGIIGGYDVCLGIVDFF